MKMNQQPGPFTTPLLTEIQCRREDQDQDQDHVTVDVENTIVEMEMKGTFVYIFPGFP